MNVRTMVLVGIAGGLASPGVGLGIASSGPDETGPEATPALVSPGPGAPGPERGSLFLREAPPAPRETSNATPNLVGASLFVVVPPEPRQFSKHDIVQIVINETSLQEYEQNLSTDKKYDISGEIGPLPSLSHLLELQLEGGTHTADWAANSDRKYEGDGSYERKDKFITRVSAEVLEVKPNGNLVLEAKKLYQSDGESVTLVISGVVRQNDVTEQNTIQSTQMANLMLRVRNEGEVKKAAEKGVITKVLDTVFAF